MNGDCDEIEFDTGDQFDDEDNNGEVNTHVIPPSRNQRANLVNRITSMKYGKIVKIDGNKGFFCDDENVEPTMFSTKFVQNFSNGLVPLFEGQTVLIEDVKRNEKIFRNVIVAPIRRINWILGEVATVTGQLNFLKVATDISPKDVLLHSDKVPKYCLTPLKKGDFVEFEFNNRNKGKPSVARVKVLSYSPRTKQELFAYFDEMEKALNGKNGVLAIIEILSSKPMWDFLVANAMESQDVVLKVAFFLLLLMKRSKAHEGLMNKVLHRVIHQLKFCQILEKALANDEFQDINVTIGAQHLCVSDLISQLVSF